MRTRHTSGDSGFSLVEAVIAMAIMLVVMGGVFQAMSTAMNATDLVKNVTNMNSTLATSMDAIVRDLIQVGQGLPIGRRIAIPNGTGTQAIVRPGPGAVGSCAGVTNFPQVASLAAVTAGAGLGPPVEGVCTDVITVLMADPTFESANVAAIVENGSALSIHPDWNISDPATPVDNLRPGDLLMLTKGTNSTLMMVSGVSGQTVTFTGGDALRLNQFDTGLVMLGTINKLRAAEPVDAAAPELDEDDATITKLGKTNATRIRMVTYYIDTTTTPDVPRLTRIINAGPPNVIGFGAHGLTFTYDLYDGNTNPTAVQMTPADLVDDGPCGSMAEDQTAADYESTCANKIRKVNVMLAMRSRGKNRNANDFFRNTLFTQVSLRNLTFTDQY